MGSAFSPTLNFFFFYILMPILPYMFPSLPSLSLELFFMYLTFPSSFGLHSSFLPPSSPSKVPFPICYFVISLPSSILFWDSVTCCHVTPWSSGSPIPNILTYVSNSIRTPHFQQAHGRLGGRGHFFI